MKHGRHRSLIRMLYCPFLSPLSDPRRRVATKACHNQDSKGHTLLYAHPTPDGSIVIVNLREIKPVSNEIYVVRVEQGLIVNN